MTLIKQQCNYCLKTFDREIKYSNRTIKKHFSGIYCSINCRNKARTTKVEKNCLSCNKVCYKTPSALKKYPNTFCSQSCSATYNNTHKTTGTRRSKLEIYLEEQIRSTYPNLKLLCNDKTAINSELDFYFPELQLAIELNGILHYEPIYGNSKLTKIKSNDSKKAFLCNQQQINLAIIDISKCKYLTRKTKEEFWNIICSLLS